MIMIMMVAGGPGHAVARQARDRRRRHPLAYIHYIYIYTHMYTHMLLVYLFCSLLAFLTCRGRDSASLDRRWCWSCRTRRARRT